ncbi:ABC transporter substrate-binding protein [Humitalea sp. 24SJ18S-53]|uniref:ABC transporter substrate-binding protein n=1 Tax=Humitalea sp. 24SJ18S-53 TaxID=3422307 RepID=UPI003D66C58D
MPASIGRRVALSAGFGASLGAGRAFAADAQRVEAARREGQVVWYTSLVVAQIVRPVAQAFERLYGIRVTFLAAPWQETTLRLLNEGRSATPRADIWDGAPTFYPLREAGLTGSYQPEPIGAYPRDITDPAGQWYPQILMFTCPAINTDLVRGDAVPRSYADLLHPRWQGRMAWSDSPSAGGPPGMIGAILTRMGEAEGMAFLRGLARQRIANVPVNQRVVLNQCISGQYPLVLSIYNYHASISMAQGAPVAWLKLDPTVFTFGTIGLMKAAPNPNAARLFLDFVLSEAGQRLHADAGYIPAHPAVAATNPGLKPDAGHFDTTLVSPDQFAANEGKWIGIWRELFH